MNDDPLRHYLSLHLWSLREAAYLLCGRAPRNESEFAREDRDNSGDVAQTYRALKDATLAGTLGFAELDGTLMRRRVVALHVLEWAVSRGVDLPTPLAALLAAGDQTAPVGSGDGHAERKAAEGRYTLEDAARAIEDGEGERQEAMLHKLMSAAHTGALPTFEPGRKARMVYGVWPGTASLVREFYEEAYWDDLNKWLRDNEPRIEYRFPRPKAGSAPASGPAKGVAPVATAGTKSNETKPEDWRALAEAEGKRWRKEIVRTSKGTRRPGPKDVADHLARWCKEQGIKTDRNSSPSFSYLRTNIVNGRWRET